MCIYSIRSVYQFCDGRRCVVALCLVYRYRYSLARTKVSVIASAAPATSSGFPTNIEAGVNAATPTLKDKLRKHKGILQVRVTTGSLEANRRRRIPSAMDPTDIFFGVFRVVEPTPVHS
jgi:hypothetical protein